MSSPEASKSLLQKINPLPFFRGLIRRFPVTSPQLEVVVLLSDAEVQARGEPLIEGALAVLRRTSPLRSALGSAHRAAEGYADDGRFVRIEAQIPVGGEGAVIPYDTVVTENQAKRPFALTMGIKGKEPKNPLFSMGIELRNTDYQKPGIWFKDTRSSEQSPNPNTEDAAVSIEKFIKYLNEQLPEQN